MGELHGGNLRLIAQKYQLSQNELIDFSANINPLGIPEEFKMLIQENLDRLCHYPDYQYLHLKQQLSDFHQQALSHCHVGNGAAEIIEDLMKVLPRDIVTLQPTFSEYDLAARKYHKKIHHYGLKASNDFRLVAKDFCEWLANEFELELIQEEQGSYQAAVFICNPNNPTGCLISKTDLMTICRFLKNRQMLLIMDESFMDFLEDAEGYEMLSACQQEANLVVLRSLTKFYAIPGLRLGYVFSSQTELIKALDQVQVTWSINTLAMVCGQEIPYLDSFRKKTWNYIEQEKDWLYQQLKQFKDLQVIKPSVNYLFMFSSYKTIYQDLLENGIVIRDCSNYPGLSQGYFRLAVRTHEENSQLIQVLQNILGEKE